MLEHNPEVVGGPDESAQQPSTAPSQESVVPTSDSPAVPPSTKPEWLKEKYKSVEDQAKAYVELEKRMGEFKGAPQDGYSFDNLPQGLSKDDPLIQGFANTFKDMNFSQEGFEKVIGKFVELAATPEDVSPERLMQELGPDGKHVLERVDNWMSNFSEEDQATIRNWKMSAADIKTLDAIRAGRSPSRAPTASEFQPIQSYESAKSVEAERVKNWNRYVNEPAYREDITERWERALLREQKK